MRNFLINTLLILLAGMWAVPLFFMVIIASEAMAVAVGWPSLLRMLKP